MDSDAHTTAMHLHYGVLYCAEKLHEIADATDDEHEARHLRAAVLMLEGIEDKRDHRDYLKALAWTMRQASIEMDDAMEVGLDGDETA